MTEDIILIFILFLLIFVQLVYIVIVQYHMLDSLINTVQNDSLRRIIDSGGDYGP